MALFTRDSIDRLRDAVDMVDLVGTQDRPAPGRVALDRAVPVPRRAHAVVLGQRRGEALLLLRLPGEGRRVRLRRADRGARLPRGGRAAGRPLRRRARARERRPAGRGAPAPARAAAEAARPHRELLREVPLGLAGGREGARLPGRARAAGGGAARVPGRLLAERLGPGARGRPAGRLQAARSWWRPGSPSAAASGGLYDRFRGRIMFPLADARGRVLGFGARAMARGARARSTSTPRRTRSTTRAASCSGSTCARAHAAKSGRIVVVEGYTDVLALHQAGIRESVAIMGTALTAEQMAELGARRAAGRAGARRRPLGAGGDAAGRAAQRTAASSCASSRCPRAAIRPTACAAGEPRRLRSGSTAAIADDPVSGSPGSCRCRPRYARR